MSESNSEWAGRRILISRPCYQYYEFDNIVSVDNMRTHTRREKWIIPDYHWLRTSNLPEGRNDGVRSAMSIGADKLLFIDSDMSVPAYALLHLLRHDVPVVSGVYVSKQPPHLYMAGTYNEDGSRLMTFPEIKPGQLIECDWVGAGFMLIDMKVFEKIEPPYFSWKEFPGKKNAGEDEYFCDKVRAAGMKVYVDTDCIVGHIGSWVYDAEDHKAFARPTVPLLVSSDGQTALVS